MPTVADIEAFGRRTPHRKI